MIQISKARFLKIFKSSCKTGKMEAFGFSWLFTFIFVFSRLSISVHGEIFPPGYLLGNVAINCGCFSNTTALDGRKWVGETPLLRPIGKSRSSTSAHRLLSADPTPYLTARLSFSYFSYLFQVNPGQKFIRLHFNPEIYQGFENYQDFFTVEANSFTLLQNFSASLAADALGGKHFVKEYCLNINETGILQISFFAMKTSGKTNNFFAFVNGIEIISMPTGLYYTPDDNLGPRIVGHNNRFHYIDNNTALELVKRLNVGGGTISTVHDTGLFRMWVGDDDYLQDSDFQQLDHFFATENTVSPAFVAPPQIYWTSRKLRNNFQLEEHFTWKIPVDVGFSYFLRLHFSFFGFEIPEGGPQDFSILMQNLVAEPQVNVVHLSGGKKTQGYADYLFMMKGQKSQGKNDLVISSQSVDELVLGLLRGLEIFKLSNPDNSLASPNPSKPKQTSSFWTMKICNILVSFGQSNIIMIALTIFLAIVNPFFYLLRRICEYTFWQERKMQSMPDEPSHHQFSLAEILLATQDFNEALVIGKGGFGKVYKGFIHGRPEVLAIKRLKPDSKQGAREFWREIETLSKLRHVHLVSLLGYCMEREEMILVYEYMPRGTIADNLYKSGTDGKERIPLSWEQRLRICIGAARGLDYLHTGIEHSVIHRDVKDTNILLDEKFVAKVSDFGLSKMGKTSETQGEPSSKIKGTIGYLDPHYIMTNKPSTKTDVYAFGVVLLVVLSGRPAVERRIFEKIKSLLECYRECITKGQMNEIIDPCLQGEILTGSLTRFVEVAEKCLHHRPKKRPTMAQVVVLLENALEEQTGAVSSTFGADIIVGQNSPPGFNQQASILTSDIHFLIDDGRKRFWLDEGSRKKCYMLAARDINITWSDSPQYWEWISLPESRFEDVAKLLKVCWLEIWGKITTDKLSPNTTYVAYLVFFSKSQLRGFDHPLAEASFGISGQVSKTSCVCLDPVGAQKGRRFHKMRDADMQCPVKRDNHWSEIGLGEFYVKGREVVELEMSLKEIKDMGTLKSGLIIEGIEIRPKHFK